MCQLRCFPIHQLLPCAMAGDCGHRHCPVLGPRCQSLCPTAGLVCPPRHSHRPIPDPGTSHLILGYCSIRKTRLRRTCSTMASMWPKQRTKGRAGGCWATQAAAASAGQHLPLGAMSYPTATTATPCDTSGGAANPESSLLGERDADMLREPAAAGPAGD